MSHGVIQNTANLECQGESGALNEHFADVFAVMIDRDDWQVSEDVVRREAFPTGASSDLPLQQRADRPDGTAGRQLRAAAGRGSGVWWWCGSDLGELHRLLVAS